jgi:F-type H+-transporting ATPase subunit gamma
MESLQSIKRRIKGVKNINQITRAMELVAANKMRRSQEVALASRPYGFAVLDLLGRLSKLEDANAHPLLQSRPVKKTAIVLITSDKGLAGAFNSSVIRKFESYVRSEKIDMKDAAYEFIAVGQKAINFLSRNAHGIKQSFTKVGDRTKIEEIQPLAKMLTEGYLKGEWDKVVVFSTHFHSALRQEPLVRDLLPVTFDNLKDTVQEILPQTGKFAELIKSEKIQYFTGDNKTGQYVIEPSPSEVLGALVPHLVEMEIYEMILEANASEWAARRMAMKSASDNAKELATDLTLAYNKSRQAAVTSQIIEITAGAEALN